MSTMPRFSVFVAKCLGGGAAILLLLLSFGEARAQLLELKSWEIDASLEGKKTEYFNAFKSGNLDPDRAALDRFFDAWYFARWTALETLADDQKVAAIQGKPYARELADDFQNVTGNAREYLLKKSFETLQKMAADGNVHPMARYNAVLAIGQLAQREGAGRNAPPELYAASLPWLIEEYRKENSPDYVKLAALIGIVRHAKTKIDDETLKTTTVPDLFLSIVESGKPGGQEVTKENREIKDWFRQLALEGFSGLKSAGAGGKIVTAMDGVMNNTSETLEIRTRAARVLGDIDYAAANSAGITLNFQQLGTSLVTLMKVVADTELQAVIQLRDKTKAMQGQPIASGPGMVESDPAYESMMPEQQIEVEGVLQNIKTNVQNVVYGLRGTRFSGSSTQGVISVLSSDDAVTLKINATMSKGVNPLIRKLDEGPPEEKKTVSSMEGMSDMSGGSGGPTRGPKPKEEKKIKVNLLDIRNALQEFSTEMGAIISGTGA